ncbi:uncharacterized mitochondrial protein-like protein [Tanacetum coccineum]
MQMKILKEACMEECNPALCPMEPGLKLSNAEDEPEVEATQYRKMIDDSLTDVRIQHFTTNQMLKNYLSLDMAIMRVPDIIGLESVSIRRIQGVGYDVLEFLRTYSRSRKRSGMMVGESSQPYVKDTTLTFQCSDDAKKNNIVKGLLFQSIPEDLILQIRNLKTGKEMWEAIKTRNLGADRVKEARLQTLITNFENLKMPNNDSIDAYAAKLSGIASKSATLGEVMSKHKLVKKFLTSLLRRFVHIVAALEQVLDLKSTGFEDVVGQLKAGGRGRGSYSRGRGRGRGQGRGRDNSQNQGQRDSSKNREDNEQKGKQHEKRDLSHIQCYRCDQYIHFVSKCPERNRNHEVNLNETQEKEKYTPPKSESNTDDEDDVWYFDNRGGLLIKVPRCANRLYKAQLTVGKEDTYEVGRESDEEVIPHSSLVTIYETIPKSEEDNSGSDDTPNPLV